MVQKKLAWSNKAGGGKAIFPEANLFGGTVQHGLLLDLLLTPSPTGEELEVSFKENLSKGKQSWWVESYFPSGLICLEKLSSGARCLISPLTPSTTGEEVE